MGLIEVAKHNLETHLVDNPCRGIVLGVNEQGLGMQIAWIMGRSGNSRNRVYVLKNGILRTEAADPGKVEDPRLIIYNVMRSDHGLYVVSNGDQTNNVFEDPAVSYILDKGQLFFNTLRQRYCEPDASNFTPRITGCQLVEEMGKDDMNLVLLSVLKANPFAREHWMKSERLANVAGVTRESFKIAFPDKKDTERNDLYLNEIDGRAGLNRREFPTLYDEFARPVEPGFGYCLTTYMPGAATLPSFSGEPLLVPMKGTLEQVMQTFWDSLKTFYGNPPEDCRVSLAGREIGRDGTVRYAKPINRYEKVA
ncbi:MAG: hypothetical protein NTX24_04610 [Candidatus Pacearchaeota archaeon]|nr:hypothetical protein [Candidatus Pacearchaeota archaeon]